MTRARHAVVAALTLASVPAAAGPPFVTDDPVPTDYRTWEIYKFGDGLLLHRGWEGEGGLDLNYGAFRDVQLTATLPLASREEGAGRIALGDVEVGAKYRFVHQRHGTAIPDVSFFPKLSLPTAGQRGTGRVGAQLPIWVGKDAGAWSAFGGGGWALNPGAGRRNYWFTGATVVRKLSARVSLGVEIFHQGADQVGGTRSTLIGIGTTYAVAPHWSILGATGTFTAHRNEHGRQRVYVALLFHG